MYRVAVEVARRGIGMLAVLAFWVSGWSVGAAEVGVAGAGQRLHALFESSWEEYLSLNPVAASSLGDTRWNDRWDDVSGEGMFRRRNAASNALVRLRAIPREGLSVRDRLNWDLFEREQRLFLEEFDLGWYLVPLNQREGIQSADDLADALRFETVKDYEAWISRLRAFPVYVDQTMDLMRRGMREGRILPRVVMGRVPAQIRKQMVSDARTSPFYKPFRAMAGGVSKAEADRLREEGRLAIEREVVPAFRRFHDFFVESYLPACFEEVGAWRMPGGERLYRFFTGKYTTVETTPERVHQAGLDEVARIREAMETVRVKVGFRGSLKDFFTHLRTDKRFYFGSGEEMIGAYRAFCKRVDPLLVRVFKTHPRTPYGVEAIPEHIAPDTTAAYYRPPAADGSRAGTYFLNLYKPEARPRYEMVALTLHEAVPGHHFQIALAMELESMPKFRRFGGYTAYIEGWGLYSESLGEEMGLYTDPYDKFGQLTYEMWRAVRLVVDTGIHAMKWSRQQAIDYFMDNAAKSELDVVNEVDRYIAWPGQALAYKTGEMEIQRLRRWAAGELGGGFDLREFHDVVLLEGALPLDLLEGRVRGWVKERQGGGAR